MWVGGTIGQQNRSKSGFSSTMEKGLVSKDVKAGSGGVERRKVGAERDITGSLRS